MRNAGNPKSEYKYIFCELLKRNENLLCIHLFQAEEI